MHKQQKARCTKTGKFLNTSKEHWEAHKGQSTIKKPGFLGRSSRVWPWDRGEWEHVHTH